MADQYIRYPATGGGGLTQDSGDIRYVRKTGDAMSGPLEVTGTLSILSGALTLSPFGSAAVADSVVINAPMGVVTVPQGSGSVLVSNSYATFGSQIFIQPYFPGYTTAVLAGPSSFTSVRKPNSFVPSAGNFTAFPSALSKVMTYMGWII